MVKFSDKELTKLVAKDVAEAGGRAYYVGGYVRDKYLGLQNKDIDVEVLGLSEQKYVDILSKYGSVDFTGKSFGVFLVKGYDIDFSMARLERKVADGHKGFEVSTINVSMEDAYMRRDFTINALMEDILTGKIEGSPNGLKDLEKGLITCVNPNTYIEDELRAFRACQFASRFNFKISDEVLYLSQQFQYNLSRERIEEELNKLFLKGLKPSIGLNYMADMEIFNKALTKVNYTNTKAINEDYLKGLLEEVPLLKEASRSEQLGLYYKILSDSGNLSQITNNKDVLKVVNNAKEFDITDYNLRKASFNGELVYSLVNMTVNNKLSIKELKMLLRKFEEGQFPTQRFVKGEDLVKLGYAQGKEMGIKLNDLLEKQFTGKTREDLLKLI